MTTPYSPAQFDELIHAPVRLRICAGLARAHVAEFSQLRDALGVADSVLSKHIKQLIDAGYINMERFSKSGRIHVRVELTDAGSKAYAGHVATRRDMFEKEP